MASPAGLGTSFTILVNSVIAMLVILEVVKLTEIQVAAINLVAVNAVIFIAGVFTYMRSTPVSNPTLPAGTRVNVTTPPGEDDRKVTV